MPVGANSCSLVHSVLIQLFKTQQVFWHSFSPLDVPHHATTAPRVCGGRGPRRSARRPHVPFLKGVGESPAERRPLRGDQTSALTGTQCCHLVFGPGLEPHAGLPQQSVQYSEKQGLSLSRRGARAPPLLTASCRDAGDAVTAERPGGGVEVPGGVDEQWGVRGGASDLSDVDGGQGCRAQRATLAGNATCVPFLLCVCMCA